MNIIKQQIANKFNQTANNYNSAALAQMSIANNLINRYQLIKQSGKIILDVGCGTGLATQQLARRFANSQVYGLDLAPAMLSVARQKPMDNLHYLCADMEQLPLPDNSVDWVFSNFSLHWSLNLAQTLQEIYRVLKLDGLLMFTIPGLNTFNELKYSWQMADQYQHVNDFLDLHDLGDGLKKSNYHDPVLDIEYLTLTYSSVKHMFADLRNLGVNYLINNQRTNHGLTGKATFQKMLRAYETLRRTDGKLPLTYEIIYGHAWKVKQPTRAKYPEISEISIPVEQLLNYKTMENIQ